MSKFFFLFFTVLLLSVSSQEQEKDALILWRGFDHVWGYNHRLNRHGDFVSNVQTSSSSCSATLGHTAASGSGPDTANFITYYSQISAEKVGFQTGSTTISISGKEKETITKNTTVKVAAQENLKNREKYCVVLNGFDLYSVESSDKLKYLKLEIAAESYDKANAKINFEIKISTNLACDSPECPLFNQKVNYKVIVHYAIVAGDSSTLNTKEQEFSRKYSWDNKKEIFLSPLQKSITGISGYKFEKAALAFRKLEVELDTYHHMLGWKTAIRPTNYNSGEGKFDFNLDLDLKQWADGMKNVHPPESWFSYKDKGSATVKAKVVLLQMFKGSVTHKSHNDSIYWGAWGSDPNSPKAEKTKSVSFDY